MIKSVLTPNSTPAKMNELQKLRQFSMVIVSAASAAPAKLRTEPLSLKKGVE